MPMIDDYETPRLQRPIGPDDHITGPDDAPATLVEYGDYECPFCGQAHQIIKQIMEDVGSDLRFVFRNFPLTQSHPRALQAALAAEAAGAQGKFWEMHDMLYENQPDLNIEDLLRYADQLGLDRERFAKDVEESRYMKKIRNDFHSGVRSGVNGTPSFFINGYRNEGAWDYESLTAAIQEAMKTSVASRKRKAA